MQLERLLNVLEMTAVAGRPISVAQLQKATGLPRPTCYRLVQTLIDHRLLDIPGDNGREYVIGERLIKLALLGKSDIDVRKATAAKIRQAAIHLGHACFLARLRNNTVEIIHVEVPEDATRSFVHPGLGQRPLHACSSAKVIAAFADDGLQDDILQSGMDQFNNNTHENFESLAEEFKTIRECGYAQCKQEISLGISSIAAPVIFGGLGPTFSVGTVAHASEFTDSNCPSIGTYLVELAETVSAAIQLCNVGEI
ncbi:MAG: IclR family transcriptional regulator [Stappiaceae bacterium]